MTAGSAPATVLPMSARRLTVTPLVEVAVLTLAIVVAVGSYFIVTSSGRAEGLISPGVVALLLVANLVPGVALMMLLGRRIARRRAANSLVGGEGRLHVRLVALFSMLAAVPMVLVTIAASLLFQYGVQFWYSDRARAVFENATTLTRTSYNQILQRWEEATVTMATDISRELEERPIDDPRFGHEHPPASRDPASFRHRGTFAQWFGEVEVEGGGQKKAVVDQAVGGVEGRVVEHRLASARSASLRPPRKVAYQEV